MNLNIYMARIIIMAFIFVSFGSESSLGDGNEDKRIKSDQMVYFKLYPQIRNANLEAVKLALSEGVDPNWSESPFDVFPMLSLALNCSSPFDSRLEVVKLLIEHGASLSWRSPKDANSLFNYLVHCTNDEFVLGVSELFIRKGLDPAYENNLGISALYSSILDGREKLAMYLVQHSEPSLSNVKTAINRKLWNFLELLVISNFDYFSLPLMSSAIENDAFSLLETLILKGASPNEFLLKRKNIRVPLVDALTHGSQNSVEILLRHGADPDLKDYKGRSYNELVE